MGDKQKATPPEPMWNLNPSSARTSLDLQSNRDGWSLLSELLHRPDADVIFEIAVPVVNMLW